MKPKYKAQRTFSVTKDGFFGEYYAGMMIFCSGLIVSCGNYILLVLPVIYYVVLTIMLKATEEKWLRKTYGDAYVNYCQRVNRCIPWFPRKDY